MLCVCRVAVLPLGKLITFIGKFSTKLQHPFQGDADVHKHQQMSPKGIDAIRARLLYQSRKRGMLENGLLLRYDMTIV